MFTLSAIAIILAVAAVVITVKSRDPKRLAVAMASFVGVMALGAWVVMQSRGSTAGIGFLFLPFFAAPAGLGGWLVASPRSGRRLLWTLQLLLGAGLIAVPVLYGLQSGHQTRARNAARDEQARLAARRVDAARAEIATLVAKSAGREQEAMADYLKAHRRDREATLAALETAFLTDAMLSELAAEPDMGIGLLIIRNKAVGAETLRKIYRTAAYRSYYAVDLARNVVTPPDVLLEVAGDQNLMLPAAMLAHPSLSCEILRKLRTTVTNGYLSAEQKTRTLEEISAKEPQLCR